MMCFYRYEMNIHYSHETFIIDSLGYTSTIINEVFEISSSELVKALPNEL